MVFGKPKARRTRGAAKLRAAELRAARQSAAASRVPATIAFTALVAAAVMGLSSCGAGAELRRQAAYSSSLSSIDSILLSPTTQGLDAAFSSAYRIAHSASDWLCLLKRGRAAQAKGDEGRYAGTADRALKAFPKSDPVAAAAAHAYLRNGSPRKALALFGVALSAEARPKLWAEAFLASMPSPGFDALPGDYGRLADITGDGRPFLGAAVASLAAGDRLAAAAWLEKARLGGVSAPAELLWDCDLYESLANRSDASAGPAELALMGDAAWMSGDIGLAKQRWARSIALKPSGSWKPYANLALLSGAKSELAESYRERMRSAFLAAPPSSERDGALGAYAASLAREGREADALAALKGGMAPGGAGSGRLAALELSIRGASMPEGRYAAELERLAALRPDDPEVMGDALRSLSARGMYGEVAVLWKGAARRKLPLDYGWFYEAEVLAAQGDLPGAAAAIRTGGGPSVEGSFALGSLYAAMGDPTKSAAEYSRAAAAARSGHAKCAALKALGRELGASGDPAGAARAYREALVADPADAEAALLARAASKK
jgi:tetratricopeptide (TPR) repeat protein